MASRPYPWKCRSCGKQSLSPVVVDYATDMMHDARLYSLAVPNLEVLECVECNKRVIPDQSFEKVVAALRVEAKLLTPEEIRENRKRLGLTQKQLAQDLDIAEETLSRWETSKQIQQRAFDKMLRAYFALPELREYLAQVEMTNKSESLVTSV